MKSLAVYFFILYAIYIYHNNNYNNNTKVSIVPYSRALRCLTIKFFKQ